MVTSLIYFDSIPIPVKDVVGKTVQNQPDSGLYAVMVVLSLRWTNVLNELGACIWFLSDRRDAVKEIAEAICVDSDINLATAEANITRYLEELLRRYVIRLADKPVG
jgi:hypothetical protein